MTRTDLTEIMGGTGLIGVGVGFYLDASLGLALIVVGSILLVIALLAFLFG